MHIRVRMYTHTHTKHTHTGTACSGASASVTGRRSSRKATKKARRTSEWHAARRRPRLIRPTASCTMPGITPCTTRTEARWAATSTRSTNLRQVMPQRPPRSLGLRWEKCARAQTHVAKFPPPPRSPPASSFKHDLACRWSRRVPTCSSSTPIALGTTRNKWTSRRASAAGHTLRTSSTS